MHSVRSLPPRFPAFCGRCRREPVRAERGGRIPGKSGFGSNYKSSICKIYKVEEGE